MAQVQITASMLYDLIQCPHRVSMDCFGDSTKRDAVSPFVQLLWDRGTAFEAEIIANLKQPLLDLSSTPDAERARLTMEAMERHEPLIYGGRIEIDGLLGVPDLLRFDRSGYVAGDIKSGSGEEGGLDESGEEGKPKVHYAVQLGLYTDILSRMGKSAGRRAFVWDIHGREVIYEFDAQYGVKNPTTLWAKYQDALAEAQQLVSGKQITLPAYSSVCKNCVWYSSCLDVLEKSDDLTLIPFLGRTKRDAMIQYIPSIKDFAATNPDGYIKGKKTIFAGMGSDTLKKFHARARLRGEQNSRPFLSAPIVLPHSERELFFDIEVDPMRNVCYLHGFVERMGENDSAEKFHSFFAERLEDEKQAFADAWQFLTASDTTAIYYYSKYERTIYRALQSKYPDVCSVADIERLFSSPLAVDLYFDVVLKATEWPTRDYSLKTLAKYLGFAWRDTHPSGAASIEWFHRWIESGDLAIKQRILEYNEDDCRATRVLLDGIRGMA